MADKFQLSAEVRSNHGKAASRRLRRTQEKVPGIVYGAGKEPTPISLSHNELNRALQNEAFYSHILTLAVDGKQEKVVLKALQRHPYKAQLIHIDFQRVSATEKLYMNVPLHFIGEDTAPGVKLEGGQVSHLMTEVEIRCLPADLPEYIEVDISKLGMDGAVHLSEIKLPKGVEIVALIQGKEHDQSVVSIHRPHVIAEPEEAVAASAEVPLVGDEGEEASTESGEEKE